MNWAQIFFDCPPILAFNYFTDQAHSRTLRVLQLATQCIISKPPPSFNLGNPHTSPLSSASLHVSFSMTVVSLSSTSNLIFFEPSPAFCKTCFSVLEGTLLVSRSDKQTKFAVHVRFLPSFFSDVFLLRPRADLFLGLKRSARSRRSCWFNPPFPLSAQRQKYLQLYYLQKVCWQWQLPCIAL